MSYTNNRNNWVGPLPSWPVENSHPFDFNNNWGIKNKGRHGIAGRLGCWDQQWREAGWGEEFHQLRKKVEMKKQPRKRSWGNFRVHRVQRSLKPWKARVKAWEEKVQGVREKKWHRDEWERAIAVHRKNSRVLTREQVEKHRTTLKPSQAIDKPEQEDCDTITETSRFYINKG